MSTLFEKIIAGEIPSYKIYEDDEHIAIIDIFPIHPGQVLVIPKKPTDYVFDIEDGEYTRLFLCAKKVAHHMKQVLHAERIGMVLEGLEVPHVHVKLIPIDQTHTIDPKHIKKLEDVDAQRLHTRLKMT